MAETATVEIQMPAMGESVSEGTVLEWHVSEGDQVEEGQTMVEVSTDKVDAEVPAPASGTVSKILVQPDETIKVGKPLAEIDGSPPSGGDGAKAEKKAEAAPAEGNGAPPTETDTEGGETVQNTM